jgi:hypothetical protein
MALNDPQPDQTTAQFGFRLCKIAGLSPLIGIMIERRQGFRTRRRIEINQAAGRTGVKSPFRIAEIGLTRRTVTGGAFGGLIQRRPRRDCCIIGILADGGAPGKISAPVI